MSTLNLRSLARNIGFCGCLAAASPASADDAKPSAAAKPAVVRDAGVERTRAWLEKQRARLRRIVGKELSRKTNKFFLVATLPKPEATPPRTDAKAKVAKDEQKPSVFAPKYTLVSGKAAAQDLVVGYLADALLDVGRILPEEEVDRVLAGHPWRLIGSYKTQAAGDAELDGRKAKDEKILLSLQGYGAPDEALIVGVGGGIARVPVMWVPPGRG